MYRVPLLKPVKNSSVSIAGKKLQGILTLDLHELAAGKLSALIDRRASRDVFDANLLLHQPNMDYKKLRTLFIIYSGISRKTDIRKPDFLQLSHHATDFQHRLAPMLQPKYIREVGGMKTWSKQLLDECKNKLLQFHPLKKNEYEFLTRLLEYGEISPELICNGELAKNVAMHPALQWSAFNAKRNKVIASK